MMAGRGSRGGMPPMNGQGRRSGKPAEAPVKPGDEQPAAAADGDAQTAGGQPAETEIVTGDSQNTDKAQRRKPGTKSGAAAQTDEKPAGADAVTGDSQSTDKAQRRRPGAKDEAAAGTNSKGPKGGRREKAPTAAAQAPDAIDFDAMLQNGVISAETREKIRTYMASETADANTGATPAPAEKPAGQADAPKASDSLLDRLLAAGVITQAEYDALTAAQTNTAVSM